MRTKRNLLNSFRKIALIEGISMIVLVICSVLKRTPGMEGAALGVTYVGWAHGILFIAYVYLLGMCAMRYGWTWRRVALFFVASLIPVAPFFVEKALKREEDHR